MQEAIQEAIQIALSPIMSDIFSGCETAEEIKKRYVDLAKEVHPDKSKDPQASSAFSNLLKMYDLAIDELKSGVWAGHGKNSALIRGSDASMVVRYLKRRTGDLGEEFITSRSLTCVIPREMAAAGIKIIDNIHLIKDTSIKKNVIKYLPMLSKKMLGMDDKELVTIGRDTATAALEDVVSAFGPLDPRHTAWILSSLYDFCCFMQYQKMVHCALTPQNVFIDTKNHSIQVIGGWWFFRPRHARLEVIPNWIHENVLPGAYKDKRASIRLDLEAVKALGRYCLAGVKSVPRSLDIWTSTASGDDAVLEYQGWEKARSDAFGMRKFVDFGNVASDAYKEK